MNLSPSVGYAVQLQTLKKNWVYTWVQDHKVFHLYWVILYTWSELSKKTAVEGNFMKVHGSEAWIFVLLTCFHFHLGNYMWQSHRWPAMLPTVTVTVSNITSHWCMITSGMQVHSLVFAVGVVLPPFELFPLQRWLVMLVWQMMYSESKLFFQKHYRAT